jgi:hypothetical protein
MGNGRWDNDDWNKHAATTKGLSQRQIFSASETHKDLEPKNIKVRESRDSKDNPKSTPIILALDVTGSMGFIAESLARDGLGTLVQSILDRKPVTDPHIMVMAVGDQQTDRGPLQVSQFEADIRVADQLKQLWLEGNGGGNGSEGYTLPWYFAATKTDVDCVKDGRKGLLFTFGDEGVPPALTPQQIKRILGDNVQQDFTAKELFEMASEKFDIYHVVIEQGDYARRAKQKVYDSWEKVLPKERIIPVSDYTRVPQILVSAMEIHAGKDPKEVLASWQGADAKIIAESVKNVKQGKPQAAATPAPAANQNTPASTTIKLKKTKPTP